MSGSISIDGVRLPRFLYGTAWKQDDTEPPTLLALRNGFRGIDTANQRKHYHEAAVGRAVFTVLVEDAIARGDLFLQHEVDRTSGSITPLNPKTGSSRGRSRRRRVSAETRICTTITSWSGFSFAGVTVKASLPRPVRARTTRPAAVRH